jgi:hypothetical protein
MFNLKRKRRCKNCIASLYNPDLKCRIRYGYAFKNKKHIIPFCLDENSYADKIEFYLCDLDQLQYILNFIKEMRGQIPSFFRAGYFSA